MRKGCHIKMTETLLLVHQSKFHHSKIVSISKWTFSPTTMNILDLGQLEYHHNATYDPHIQWSSHHGSHTMRAPPRPG